MQQYSALQEFRWIAQEKGRVTPADRERIAREEPVDYVIGFVDFLGCKIDLSRRPFIPRPETEYWTEKAIRETLGRKPVCNRRSKSLRDFGVCALGGLSSLRSEPCQTASESLRTGSLSSLTMLDLFAGSGCMGIALLKHIPRAIVDFGEKEKKFLEQIAINAKLNGIKSDRYRLISTDIFSRIRDKYDFIFANPPYCARARRKDIQQSVLVYEPREALFGGEDGLLFIRKFLQTAREHLKPGGKIYLEFDSWQKKSLAKLMRSHHFSCFEFFKDQYGKWRYLTAQW